MEGQGENNADAGNGQGAAGGDAPAAAPVARLRTIPPEIWEMVLNRLQELHDLRNAILSNPAWNALMHGKKTKFLFPQVLPILLNNIAARELMNCRGACRLWRDSVDYLLQHGPQLRAAANQGQVAIAGPSTSSAAALVPLNNVPRDHPIFGQTTITFTKASEIVRMLADMEDRVGRGRNPFPARSVAFSPETRGVHVSELVTFEEQMRLFLARYGSHLWRFHYKLPVYETPTDGLNMLARLLYSLPNVRTIYVEDGFHWYTRRATGGRYPWAADVREGAEEEVLPFPDLPRLTELSLPNNSLFHVTTMRIVASYYGEQGVRIEWHNEPSVSLNVTLGSPEDRRGQWGNRIRVVLGAEGGNEEKGEDQIDEEEDDDDDDE